MTLQFGADELRDLLVAWLALGLAFTVFFLGGGSRAVRIFAADGPNALLVAFAVSLVTAGVAFLVHELAHKVVAVRFGQVAQFRADYGMLFLAIMSAFVGFLFAAPGAVHHYGNPTERQNGLIALAGPVVNGLLAAVFVPLALVGNVLDLDLVALVGARGLAINLFLGAFNLVPYGPLDGRTVLGWSKIVWVASFLPLAALTVLVVFVMGVGF